MPLAARPIPAALIPSSPLAGLAQLLLPQPTAPVDSRAPSQAAYGLKPGSGSVAVRCCAAVPLLLLPRKAGKSALPKPPPSPMPTKRAHEPASPQAHRPVPLQPLPSASTSNRSVNEIAWSVQPARCQMALTSTTPISVGSALFGRRPCVASSHPNPSLEPFRRPPDDGWMEWMDAMAGSLSDGHGHDSLKIMFYRNLRLRHAMSPFPALFHFCLKS